MMSGKLRTVAADIRNPLFRNAYALMLNTVVNSALGLAYWMIAAREFSADDVGRANALLALMLLVATLTQLNFGQALIRFLPVSGTRAPAFCRNAYVISVLVGVTVAGIAGAVCHTFGPEHSLYMSTTFVAWFVLSVAMWTIFNLQDSVLTGLRQAQWVPLENGVFGVAKIALIFAVLPWAGRDGIFYSWTIALPVLLVAVNLLLFRKLIPAHAVEEVEGSAMPASRDLAKYMAGDFAGQVFTQLASTFLPILVISVLSDEDAAYLLPAQTIWTAMNMLSFGITSSLVVEAARDEANAHHHARAVLKRIVITVFPVAAVMAIAAPWVLALYGDEYREHATRLLQLLMISTVPRIVISLYTVILRLQKRTVRLAAVLGAQTTILLGGTALLAPSTGLDSVGWAALASQLVPAVVLGPGVFRWLRRV